MMPKHISPVANKIATSPASSDSSRAGNQSLLSMGVGLGEPSNSRSVAGAGAGRGADASRSRDVSSRECRSKYCRRVWRGWLLADGISFLWVCARSLRSVPSMLHAAVTTAMAVDEDGDSSMQMAALATGGMDEEFSSVPLLERARRRKSMLLGKP